MTLPVVLPNYFQERAGVIQVAAKLNQLGLIFRETPNADVGIDGQIEHVNEKGEASGKLLAEEIKIKVIDVPFWSSTDFTQIKQALLTKLTNAIENLILIIVRKFYYANSRSNLFFHFSQSGISLVCRSINFWV